MSGKSWTQGIMAGTGALGLLLAGAPGYAAEHGGQEHGGQEHGGMAMKAEPSAAEIRQVIQAHVNGIEASDGAFEIEDEVTGATRRLTFVRVHERVGKTGELYYSCTDMQDTATGELLDLDFDVDASDGHLHVMDTRLHKVDGQARYTYDANDNRIPLPQAGQAQGE